MQPPYVTKLVPFLSHLRPGQSTLLRESERQAGGPVRDRARGVCGAGGAQHWHVFSQRQLQAQPVAYTAPLGHSQRDFQPPANSFLTRPLSHDVFLAIFRHADVLCDGIWLLHRRRLRLLHGQAAGA